MPHTVDRLLERRELSLAQLAEAAALSVDRLDAIVSGRWTPSPDERSRIAAALGVDVNDVNWGHTMNPRNVRYHRYGLPDGGFDNQL